ncbi:MAG: glucosamine inositolphosphorylceramide transferase family protein [Betaproteobacteria bacterium]
MEALAATAPGAQPLRLPARLRVGVFADNPLQPRWLTDALVRAGAEADVFLIRIGTAAPGRAGFPWNAYAALDRYVFGAEPADLVDLHSVLTQGSIDELDVAFAVGDFDDSGLDAFARLGVWRFHFGAAPCEPLAGIPEAVRGEPLTCSGLAVRLAAGATPRLVCPSWGRTYLFSVARSRDQLLRKCGEFVSRALREAQRSGRGWLEQCHPLQVSSGKELRASDLLRIGGRLLARGMEKALSIDQWFLAYKFDEKPVDLREDLAGFTRVVPPKDRDWADPFVLEKNGRYFVFFEELPYAAGKAHISMFELRPDGNRSAAVKVLQRDYHLSYPFLLQHDGELYMVPESARNGTVELWRCVDFPAGWRLEKVLLDGVRCVDATLHQSGGRWWLFCNAAPGGSRAFDDELHLFHAESLLGEWTPHPRNPVKSDARSARPAGQVSWRNGALYRPAQICVPRYGAGLSINRILRLTPRDYAERQVQRILPAESQGLLGLHTVNRAGYLTVVDAFHRRRRI